MIHHGTVKWFNEQKGFGFVESEGKDYFAHFKAIQGTGYKTLKEGERIEFLPFKGVKGMEAHDIRVIRD